MKIYLAPLEGITGWIFRSAVHECFGGFDKYFVPFIKPNQMGHFSAREKKDILPDHNRGMYTVPQILTNRAEDFLRTAKKLEEYRYQSLPGAHKKAKGNHYKGAQFPWESAWLDDGEVTPVWGAADIITGLPTKIWSGFIEEHITADVVYGLWQYCTVTGDRKFMDDAGYELMMDTAIYWVSRMTEGADGKLHILDVVGPDEYKEHVDDNAFTNYMAHWNIQKAIEYHDMLRAEKAELFARLDAKLGLAEAYATWTGAVDRV